MTRTIRTRIAQFVGVVLALFAGSAVAAATAQTERGTPSVVLLVAGKAAENPQVLARAKAASDRTGAQLRVAHTTADELGVTHLLAASRYDEVLTIGVDRRIAIDPVAARYPDVRFTSLD